MLKTGDKVERFGQEFTVISAYDAEQAEQDGVLINVTTPAKLLGFNWPVRITATLNALCGDIDTQGGFSNLMEILAETKRAIGINKDDSSLLEYNVQIGQLTHRVWAAIDGTMGEPALHIMLPEDY